MCSFCMQSDMDDSYPGAKADIERLRVEKKLYAVHNHDLREFVLYSRCTLFWLSCKPDLLQPQLFQSWSGCSA